jgi:hypothetical protein
LSVYHSPGLRILWTQVAQGNRRDVVRQGEHFGLSFGLSVDPFVWQHATFGFRAAFSIFYDSDDLARYHEWAGWSAQGELPGFGSPSIWLGWFWNRADHATGGRGLFRFRPSFLIWQSARPPLYPVNTHEFAVAEDHYFYVDV